MPSAIPVKIKGLGNWLRVRKVNITQIMKNPNLIAWFGTNIEDGTQFNKLHALPIGLPYVAKEYWEGVHSHVQESTLREGHLNLDANLTQENEGFSDVHLTNNHSARHHNIKSRAEIFEEIKDNPMIDFQDSFMNRTSQWKKRSQYMFSISQIGYGFDCYRTWKAYYLVISYSYSPHQLTLFSKTFRLLSFMTGQRSRRII